MKKMRIIVCLSNTKKPFVIKLQHPFHDLNCEQGVDEEELIREKMLWNTKTWQTTDNEGGKSIDLLRDHSREIAQAKP